MKLVRIRTGDQVLRAVVEDGGYRITGEDWEPSNSVVPAAEAELVAPVEPLQVVAIGLNYRGHATESGMPIPSAPQMFVKTPNTIVGPGASIILPAMAPEEVDYEAELVIVMGRDAKNVSEEDAADFILGYTCGNDVSARDCQLRQDVQWARGKCFDTFAPIGPWIETDADPDALGIRLKLNGETMQESNTSDLIFSCRQLVGYLSRCMTLYAGSIIMTGTPPGVGFSRKPPVFLKEGDGVTVEIDGIGSLTNPVAKESA